MRADIVVIKNNIYVNYQLQTLGFYMRYVDDIAINIREKY